MTDRKTKTTGCAKRHPSRAAKWSAYVYRSGRRFANRVGLRRSPAGRAVLAALNAVGEIAANSLVFGNRAPIGVDGHSVQFAGEHAPSPALVSAVVEGDYERATRRMVERLLPRGGTFIDIGAHVGLYTLAAARRAGPRGRIYAFEPDPDNYRLLKNNIQRNGYTNVTALPLAVSARSGRSPFFLSRQGNDRHSFFPNPNSIFREQCRSVETIALDDFVASTGWPDIDLVKMDIEGAEPLAIAGMGRLLDRPTCPHLIVEFSPGMLDAGQTPPGRFLADLAARDLELFFIEDDASLVPLRNGQFEVAAKKVRARGVINLLCRKAGAGQKSSILPAACGMGDRL